MKNKKWKTMMKLIQVKFIKEKNHLDNYSFASLGSNIRQMVSY